MQELGELRNVSDEHDETRHLAAPEFPGGDAFDLRGFRLDLDNRRRNGLRFEKVSFVILTDRPESFDLCLPSSDFHVKPLRCLCLSFRFHPSGFRIRPG